MIVTSSLKDCMVFRLLGFNSLAPQSESSFLNENQFQMLSMRFKNIIINYDNDETGLKFMRKYSQQFGIKSFVIPDGIKDISDYISIKGYDETKKLTKNLKDYLISISQKEVAAMRAYKTDAQTMANHFGITVREMRDVLIKFGFAKPTKTSVDYVINPVFDFIINKVDSFDTITPAAAVDGVYDAISDCIAESYPVAG